MTALPMPTPPSPHSEPDPSESTSRAASIADYPTAPLPPLPPGVADEVTQDDLLDLVTQMQTVRLLPLEKRARMESMLRLMRIGHESEARRLVRVVAEDDYSIGQLREVETSYREQEWQAGRAGDLRRVRLIHAKLRELAHDLGVVQHSRNDHERQRQEHMQAAASIARTLRETANGKGGR